MLLPLMMRQNLQLALLLLSPALLASLQHDATIEKDESHAGKVCLRSWYERNKHIFPATRWEPFDSTKDYGSYSISDKLKDKP